MSDETPDQASGATPSAPPIAVNLQYVKDLSFEAPNAPAVFGMLQKQTPDISVNVDVSARSLQEGVFEVALDVKSECRTGEAVAFIVELAYAGVFTINVEAEHLEPVLLIECPRLLFPFARQILAGATRDGGFPPLMIGPPDFVAMYRAQLETRQAEQAATAPETETEAETETEKPSSK